MRRIAAFSFAALALGAGTARAGVPARDGASSYAANCAYCHGAAGRGDGPNAARMKPRVPDLTKSRLGSDGIESIVRDGKGACPSWKASLPPDEIRAVAAHAKSLQK